MTDTGRPRPISNYIADTKRTLRGRSPEALKLYAGRHMVHVLVADMLHEEQTGERILSPALRKALELMRDLALKGKN